MIKMNEDHRRALRLMLRDGHEVITSYELARNTNPDNRRNRKGPRVPDGKEIALAARFLADIYKYGCDGYIITELPGKYVTVRIEKCTLKK